ncbi:hypothetical protein D554_0247 [Bordetella holmesii 30539]|nr:hypothetical protein D554_0247 [Bordetella holmesii 30539]
MPKLMAQRGRRTRLRKAEPLSVSKPLDGHAQALVSRPLRP